MGTIKSSIETARTQISGASTAMNSLANNTYVAIGTINHATNDPLEEKLEIKVTPGTVSGNKRVTVFAQASLDGTNFESGPTSGTSTTDEPNLRPIGEIPCNTNSVAQTRIFDLAGAYPSGALPHSTKIVIRNETGAALASSGNDAWTAQIWAVTA